MSLTSNPTSLKTQLDAANPNTLPSKLQQLKAGSIFAAIPTSLRKKTTAADPYALVAVRVVSLPEDVKAGSIFTAYARAGAGTLGPLTVLDVGVTPVAGQVAVAPNGDIATAVADAWTSLDVVYLPEKYDVAEITLPVTLGVMTLPPALTTPGVVLMMEAEALAAGATGKKIILIPGSAPAAGQAALNLAKTTVVFAAADVVTSARVKVAVSASVDVQALLEAASTTI
jgi:hypothetical protein